MPDIPHNLVGNSAAIGTLVRQAVKAAQSDSTVLIRGETGTGKELVARAIHENSKRAARPFVAVNCAAMPEHLLESEMFGHEKGAFTGALDRKLGEFERAEGGTLFLDEIGELPVPMQPKLLRALQERQIKRLGGARTIPLDIRIIAASNRDLRFGFREDLYYRLKVISIWTPALRERPEDILVLANHFTSIYGRKSGRVVRGIASEAERVLESYSWPGNVRELQNAIESAITMGSTDVILAEDLPDLREDNLLDYDRHLDAARRALVQRAYTLANGHHETASALLGLHPNYVYTLINKYNMTHLRKPSRRYLGRG